MRPVTVLALLSAATVVTACAPMQWVKPDATAEQLQEDSIYCQQEAWREARSRAWYYRPFASGFIRDASGRAFLGGPYGPYNGPFGDPYLDEYRLAQFCMRSKGYDLQPVEKPKAQAEEPKERLEPK
jgi:hypothetical protein